MFGGHKAAIFTQVGQFYFGRWVSFSSAVTAALISKQDTSGKTPKDQIYELFSIYKRTKYEEIIDMILSKTPESFERVVWVFR